MKRSPKPLYDCGYYKGVGIPRWRESEHKCKHCKMLMWEDTHQCPFNCGFWIICFACSNCNIRRWIWGHT